MFKLRDYQQDLFDVIVAAWLTVRAVLAVLATGGGKCLAKGTPILMYDGTVKPVEDVRKGDLLMGPDSRPRKVRSTCRGVEEMYRVKPVKGDPYTVNKSHILSLKQTGIRSAPRYPSQGGKGAVVNLGITEYLAKSKTFKHQHKGWRAAVDWPVATVSDDLPPYMLGLWLGDGSSRTPSITTADRETVDYIKGFCLERGFQMREELISKDNAAKTYHLKGGGKWYAGMGGALRKEDLLLNKHVPLKYKATSRENRLALLAGLIDSDGHLHHNGYDIVFKNKRLADDTAYVARSLGFAANPRQCTKICGNTGAAGTYYRFSVTGDISEIPVRIPRKKAAPRKQKKDVLRTGITVEPVGLGEYYGFEIDGDHLFMLGDFTVTHNTVVFSALINNHVGASAAVVHRKEILSQISCSLAGLEVKHRVIAPPAVMAMIRRKHLKRFGRSFIDPHAPCGIISVQSVTSKSSLRDASLQRWLKQVTLCVFDEGHHYVTQGIWGRAVGLMAKAKLLFVTATPERADGKGLGVDADGFCEVMVEGPSTQELMRQGYLSGFTYKAPKTDLNMDNLPITASGEVSTKALRARTIDSHLVGNVVQQHRQFARGKKTIVFTSDVDTAEEVAAEFRANGVTACALSGETDGGVRDRKLDEFEFGDLTVLVNCELFDEGFDVPGVECVILARITMSLAKFLQMCGRGFRVIYAAGFDLQTVAGRLAAIAAGPKSKCIIIDPVRNWERHGMPNWPRKWSLEAREKGGRAGPSDTMPQRVCLNVTCTQPYEAYYKACPYCGTPAPEPGGRSLPEQVDGDLMDLDVEGMAALFAKLTGADMSDEEFEADMIRRHVPAVGRSAQLRHHQAARYRRSVLHELVGWWIGMQPAGRALDEKHRRFFHRFGIDIGMAFTLNAKETDALIERIQQRFAEDMT